MKILTSSQISTIMGFIPTHWLDSENSPDAISIKAHYFIHKLSNTNIFVNNMVIISFLIEIGNLVNVPDNIFEDTAIFSRIDSALQRALTDSAAKFARSKPWSRSTCTSNDSLVLPISRHMDGGRQSIRSKAVFCIVSDNSCKSARPLRQKGGA
jgi:hypothetical protein